MKKHKNILIIGGLILGVGLISLAIFFINKDSKDNSKELVNKGRYDVYQKKVARAGKDGWVYYFFIEGLDNANDDEIKIEKIKYYFNAVNLKYETLPDYVGEVTNVNEKGEKVVVDTIPTYPNLYVSHKMKDGIKESDEVNSLMAFFNKKQFTRPITLKDLEELDLVFIDKDLLLSMFNELTSQVFTSNISKYEYLYEGDYRKDNLKDGYSWQVSLIPFRTGILYVYIDMKYENGKYLSDYIASNKATKKQKELYQNIQDIANFIVLHQYFDISKDYPKLKTKDYQRLFTLLMSYEKAS